MVIRKEFSEVTAELSSGRARGKQVVQLRALPLSCSSQACKHSSVGKRCSCVHTCDVMYAFPSLYASQPTCVSQTGGATVDCLGNRTKSPK